jgi:rhamnulokinase
VTTPDAGWVAAVDLGATSGRVMLGHVGPGELELEVVHRFPSQPVRTGDGLHWNILELYRNVLLGLRQALAGQPDVVSIGIDSWAVDYALMRGARMVSTPFHYRDERTAAGVAAVHQKVDPAALYAGGGLQFQPFNTLYQLAVDASDGIIDNSTTMLMIPDLLAFWLTGEARVERTNASTTGLLEVTSGDWNTELIGRLGMPRSLFPPVIDPGMRIGPLQASVAAELDAPRAIDVVAVGSHDTASAVVGVPMVTENAAYISSGTWSLVGVELDRPVLSEASREANFTNEGGVDGKVRYLKNVMGMWLLSESMHEWERAGEPWEIEVLLDAAAALDTPVAVFDANHPSLLPAGDMVSRIADLCGATGMPVPRTPPEFARSILESLAVASATALEEIERLSGVTITTVHVVGGGSQNALLGQLTADRTGLPVLAGPVEATAIGNMLVQARAAGLVHGGLGDLRALVAQTYPPVEYRPAEVRASV